MLRREGSSPDLFADVTAFHTRFNVQGNPYVDWLIEEDVECRLNFLEEEWREAWEAWGDRDLPKLIDAHLDLIYVAVGTLVKMGLTPAQFAACWSEVQRANMAKVAIPGQWKIGKPDGWRPPDIARALRESSPLPCIECGTPTTQGRLCNRCYVEDKL